MAPDWAALREAFEAGKSTVTELAKQAGITRQKLSVVAAREGWSGAPASKQKSQGTRDTIKRLKALLQQRLAGLEAQLGTLGQEASAASSERDIRAANMLVRTLEKVLELERKDRAKRSRSRKQHRALDDHERKALAERIAALGDGPAEAGGGDVGAGGP